MHRKIIKIIENKIKTSKHKKINKMLGFIHNINHNLIHIEELVVVGAVGFFSIMMANNTGLYGTEFSKINYDIGYALEGAIDSIRPGYEESRIINQRQVEPVVKNTFYPGYCTYGAAVISPEFFPYIAEDQQARTWGGNASQRCENAQEAGFKIGTKPKQGSLIVYAQGDRYASAGHVGKVMYYHEGYGKMIVRDMNRVGKHIMSDRREYIDTKNIKCYIYPTKLPKEIIVKSEEKNIDKVLPIEEIKKIEKEFENNKEEILANRPTNSLDESTNKIEINNVKIDLGKLSPELEHFLSKQNIEIITETSTNMKIGEERKMSINITDKITNKKFSGILPKPFSLISSNTKISLDYSFIQLISNGKADIKVKAVQKGQSIIILKLGDTQIAKIEINID